MADVKVKGFKGASVRLRLKLGRAIKKSKFEEQLIEAVRKEIRDNGVTPELSNDTIFSRLQLETSNNTHPKYSASKSNLTFSGELIDSLVAKFLVRKLAFTIKANKKSHALYKNARGERKGTRVTNAQILAFQKDLGRDIEQIFSRVKFKAKVSGLLKQAIINNL